MTRDDGKTQDKNGECAGPTASINDGLTERDDGKMPGKNGECARPTALITDGMTTRNEGKMSMEKDERMKAETVSGGVSLDRGNIAATSSIDVHESDEKSAYVKEEDDNVKDSKWGLVIVAAGVVIYMIQSIMVVGHSKLYLLLLERLPEYSSSIVLIALTLYSGTRWLCGKT